MSDWAIEAEHLVKKFPHRKMEHKETANGRVAAGSESTAETPAVSPTDQSKPARRGWWPFKPRPPKVWLTAVAGVSIQIPRGEIFGLLGPNGAGKSTTIRMLCTLLEPTTGTARIIGFDVISQANQVRQSLGTVLAGERSIYWKLSARENLAYFAALYHIPPEVASRRIQDLLERVELAARADELVEKYSSGMKQRVVIARALLARPPILMLDEPTLGLDPQAARKVRELIAELKAEGHTILLTTHYMEEADQLSDRIGIIDNGKIIALDTPAVLKERINQKDVIHLEIAGWQPEFAAKLQQLPVENLVTRHLGSDSLYAVSLHAENSRSILPGLIERLNTNGTRLVNMNIVKPSLEDVFINLTGKALRD